MNREKQISEIAKIIIEYEDCGDCENCVLNDCCGEKRLATNIYNAGYRKIPDNIGDFSDGYHTFNELYHHRAVLFSVICNMFPEKAWKSKLHDTGDMFDGMFIVGIETEQGQATYHYDVEPYWDMFKVKELEKAPKWEGHTPSDAIQRIGSISSKQSEWISVDERLPKNNDEVLVCAYNKALDFSVVSIDRHNGYGEWEGLNRDYNTTVWSITHWMPLPEAPKMKGGAE